MHTLARFCESQRRFSLLLSLKYITYFFLSVCSLCSLPAAVLLLAPLLHSRGARPSAPLSPPFLPSACPAAVCVCCCRHSSAIRRKTVWQCGQMHRVYIPGLISSCLCAAVPCPAACPMASCRVSVCVCCCRVSSGGNNSLYASISRAAAMRCSVCNVMLLLSIWI